MLPGRRIFECEQNNESFVSQFYALGWHQKWIHLYFRCFVFRASLQTASQKAGIIQTNGQNKVGNNIGGAKPNHLIKINLTGAGLTLYRSPEPVNRKMRD